MKLPFRIIRKLIPSIYTAPFFQRVKALSRNHLINLWFSYKVASQELCVCVCTCVCGFPPFLFFAYPPPLLPFIPSLFISSNVSYFLNLSWLELAILLSLMFQTIAYHF